MGFVSLYTAFSGLQASQAAIDTASHNVSNAATPGYTRQRVDLASRLPHYAPFGPVGTGVDIQDITRARSAFLDDRVWASAGNVGRMNVLADLLTGLEQLTGEPDQGITAALGGLWTSFENLTLDPPDAARRLDAIAALDAVAARIRSVATAWDGAAAQAANGLSATVDEVNSLAQRIATINAQVVDIGSSSPNDLLDARDQLVDRLAQLAGVSVVGQPNGTVRVSVAGMALVDGTAVNELAFDPNTATVAFATGTPVTLGGELAGYHAFLSDEVPTARAALNSFAAELATALNATHGAGYTPAGAPGGALLNVTAGDEARTIQTAISNPAELAAAGSAGPPVAAFDGQNAEALTALRTTLVAAGGAATLDDVMRTLVIDLGSAVATADASARSNDALLSAAKQARLEVHGVSLEEEMVSLLNYQRTFEASARVMTAVDQMLETLINGTGIAGR